MGIPVHWVDAEKTHTFIKRVIDQNEKALVLNVNIHCVNLALEQKWLKNFLNQAQLVFCDGDGIRWGLKILGLEPPPKITYDRWIWQLADFADKNHYRLFFLGGRPGIAQMAKHRLLEWFPGLKVVGTEDGYFAKQGEENERMIQKVNAAGVDILILGFGMPLQEKWLEENWRRLRSHIFLTGGAVFDYVSGSLRRAPGWMIALNLEWLFRLSQEPRRLFRRYVFGIPYFFARVLTEKMKGCKS